MRRPVLSIAAASLLLCASAAHAVVETWSNDNDTEGWYSFAGSVTLTQDPDQDNLRWEGTDFLVDAIMADAGASGGAFVGDLAAAGGLAFELDLLVDEDSKLYFIAMSLLNTTTGDEWRYYLTPITPTEWGHYVVPLTDGTDWQYTGGPHDFDWMVRNVEKVGVIVTTSFMNLGSASGRIDNFELFIPEPASLLTTCAAAAALLLKRRRRERG